MIKNPEKPHKKQFDTSYFLKKVYSPICCGLSRSPLMRILELDKDSFLVKLEMVLSLEETWDDTWKPEIKELFIDKYYSWSHSSVYLFFVQTQTWETRLEPWASSCLVQKSLVWGLMLQKLDTSFCFPIFV